MKGERLTPSFASKHSGEEQKSGHIQPGSQCQVLPRGKNGGAEHRRPSCCPSQRHGGDTQPSTQAGCAGATLHSTLLSMTLTNSFKLASTFSHQLSSPLPIFIPTRMCMVCPLRLEILQKLFEFGKPSSTNREGTEQFWLSDTYWIWDYVQTTLSSPKHTYCLLLPLFTDSEGTQWNRYALE